MAWSKFPYPGDSCVPTSASEKKAWAREPLDAVERLDLELAKEALE